MFAQEQAKAAEVDAKINRASKKITITKLRPIMTAPQRTRLLVVKVPVVSGLPFGHVRHNATLPVGVRVTLDADQADLVIEEPAVS